MTDLIADLSQVRVAYDRCLKCAHLADKTTCVKAMILNWVVSRMGVRVCVTYCPEYQQDQKAPAPEPAKPEDAEVGPESWPMAY